MNRKFADSQGQDIKTELRELSRQIGHVYNGKTLPKNLADLTNRGVSCPKTGRQSIQKDKHANIFSSS